VTDETIISAILEREGGGFVDHPADRGGPTRHGVTQATLSEWLGRPASRDEVELLSETDARQIYRDRFIYAPRLFKVGDGRLRALLVDCAVNHGPGTAVKFLQHALGVVEDGVIGPATLAKLETADALAIYRRVCAERVRYYGRIISNNHSQAVFAAGWCARAAEFIEDAA